MASRRKKSKASADGIDWLARDLDFVEGLDHLGIQVVSTNIYSRLLPGISNLTDRARYFAFYSWVLDSFARTAPDKSADAWRTWIRRHEFALSAAGVAAEREVLDRDVAGGLIGAITARRLTKAGTVDIDWASRLENGKAAKGTYFKNREGGYAAYYKGPMTALGLLRVDESRKAPDRQLTAYAGARIAAAVESSTAFRELRELAEQGAEVSVEELSRIGRTVHPGTMEPTGEEARLLRDLLLGEDNDVCAGQLPSETDQRRRTLALLLHYLAQSDEDDWANEVVGFRWCILERRLGDGGPWTLPPALESTAVAWAAYAQNELLNFALECLLYAALTVLEETSPSPRTLASQLANWACEPMEPGGTALPSTLGQALRKLAPPSAEDCWSDRGTFALQDELNASEDAPEVASRAARLLLRVAVDRDRYAGHDPFAQIPQGDAIAAAREVHLRAWWDRVDEARDSDTREFFETLILEWVLFRHLRVATRKLANQGDYTYRFRPEEGALVKCGDFEPTFTNPRARQAMRVLADIGLVAHDLRAATELGSGLLERFA